MYRKQRIVTPQWHLILPLFFLEVHVCSAPVLYFSFVLFMIFEHCLLLPLFQKSVFTFLMYCWKHQAKIKYIKCFHLLILKFSSSIPKNIWGKAYGSIFLPSPVRYFFRILSELYTVFFNLYIDLLDLYGNWSSSN